MSTPCVTDSASPPAPSGAPARGKRRRKRSGHAIRRYDARTHIARRIRDLIQSYQTALGSERATAPGMDAAIRQAAELVAIGEQMRARTVRGEDVDLDALIKMENASARAVRQLRLKPGAGGARMPTLAEYLAEKAK